MQRIDSDDAVIDQATGRPQFTGGSPILQIPPTTVSAAFMNALQEEVAQAVEVLQPLSVDHRGQLAQNLLTFAELGALATLRSFDSDVVAALLGVDADDAGMIVWGMLTPSDNLLVSYDSGNTWGKQTIGGSASGGVREVRWGNNLWVALGNDGAIYTAPTNVADGAGWTQRSPATGYTGSFRAAHYAAALGLWILVGDQRGNDDPVEIQTSPDGITWTRREPPMPSRPLASQRQTYISSRGARVVMTHRDDIYTTTDGITWTLATYPRDEGIVGSLYVSAVPDGFRAVSLSNFISYEELGEPVGVHAWSSADGVTWTSAPIIVGRGFVVSEIDDRSGLIAGQASGSGSLPANLVVVAPPYTMGSMKVIRRAPPGVSGFLRRTRRFWFGRVGDIILTSGQLTW